MMKTVITLLFMAMVSFGFGQDAKARTYKKAFHQVTHVSITIQAPPKAVWDVLTNIREWTVWNSTVKSITGECELNKKVQLVSTLDPERIFELKVTEMDRKQRMIWSDGKGTREYRLKDNMDGTTTFYMSEKIGGLMFPMYKNFLPDFVPSFNQFAEDLKKRAEQVNESRRIPSKLETE